VSDVHANRSAPRRRRRSERKKVRGNVAVAIIDILGFKDLSRQGNPQRIFDEVLEPLVHVRRNAAAVASALWGRREEVFTLAFSDTIVVYRPQRSDFPAAGSLPPRTCIRLVGAAVGDIIRTGLARERPILFRGAIGWGECLISPVEPRCFIGAPMVEAYCLERDQEWIGAVLAPSAAVVFGEHADAPFVRYDVPLKNGLSMAHALAVNWPRAIHGPEVRFERLPPPAADLSDEQRASVYRKQENTRRFHDVLRPSAAPRVSVA
jgi:hypothetical protein